MPGGLLAAFGTDAVKIWSGQDGKLAFELRPRRADSASQVQLAGFSSDGQRMLLLTSYPAKSPETGESWEASLWDAASGQAVGTPISSPTGVRGQAPFNFSSDFTRALSLYGKAVQVWDFATGQRVCPPLTHPDAITHALLSPDGRRVATTSTDEIAQVWVPTPGRSSRVPLSSRLLGIAFSGWPSIVVGANNGTAHFNAETEGW